jgi:Bacterial PH domain
MFTTKRLISCDKKGIMGKSIEYTSLPWTSILGFSVATAGLLDLDCELYIYTDIMYDYCDGSADLISTNVIDEVVSIAADILTLDDTSPGMSMLEFAFNKETVNIIDIHKYLSARILGREMGVTIPPNMMAAAPAEGFIENLLSRWGDDMIPINAQELNIEFHTSLPILIDGEDIVMSFKAGRDITLFTNKRILTINTRGLTGKKRWYYTIPYESIRAFSVESSGR